MATAADKGDAEEPEALPHGALVVGEAGDDVGRLQAHGVSRNASRALKRRKHGAQAA